jgi:hypothetical protein
LVVIQKKTFPHEAAIVYIHFARDQDGALGTDRQPVDIDVPSVRKFLQNVDGALLAGHYVVNIN